jgi:ATP-binding cassette subfamily B protein
LWPYVRPFWRQVAGTLLLFLPIFALELAPAWIVKSGIDRVVADAGLEQGGGARVAGAPGPETIVSRLGETIDARLSGVLEPPGDWGFAPWLALLYLVTTLVLGGLQYVYQVLMASTGQYAMRELRSHVFRHIQTLQMSYFDVIPVGRLVTRATNDVENVA